ncbi:MAG: hypothetical protein CR988_00405 [Treponema sp.]|nr:MAG: hypothetical protein CR988_00405 [Treponema sp.]
MLKSERDRSGILMPFVKAIAVVEVERKTLLHIERKGIKIGADSPFFALRKITAFYYTYFKSQCKNSP